MCSVVSFVAREQFLREQFWNFRWRGNNLGKLFPLEGTKNTMGWTQRATRGHSKGSRIDAGPGSVDISDLGTFRKGCLQPKMGLFIKKNEISMKTAENPSEQPGWTPRTLEWSPRVSRINPGHGSVDISDFPIWTPPENKVSSQKCCYFKFWRYTFQFFCLFCCKFIQTPRIFWN